jgi:hypothetical protein
VNYAAQLLVKSTLYTYVYIYIYIYTSANEGANLLLRFPPTQSMYRHWLLVCSCCNHLEHRASVKRFVSLPFLNLRHSVGLPGRVISPSQGRYLTQTQNKQTDIHALSGIRTHDPSVRASEDSSCLRPRGHCDRHVQTCYKLKRFTTCLSLSVISRYHTVT